IPPGPDRSATPRRSSPRPRRETPLAGSRDSLAVVVTARCGAGGLGVARVTGAPGCFVREPEHERAPLSLDRRHDDLAVVVRGDVANDRQAEPGAAGRSAAGSVDPVEALEDAVEVALRDAHPLVADGDLHP